MQSINYSYGIFKDDLSSPAPHIQREYLNGIDVKDLIKNQLDIWTETYHTSCFNVKQLQEILNIGESNVYTLLNCNEFPVIIIGNRKVVPIATFAAWLINK